MGKTYLGSPSYRGAQNSDIVLPDGDFENEAVASLDNTDWNAVIEALERSEMPRIVQFSQHNYAMYACSSVEFAADGEYDRYTLSYPTLDGGATVHISHLDIPKPTKLEAPCGNGWSVSIIITKVPDDSK